MSDRLESGDAKKKSMLVPAHNGLFNFSEMFEFGLIGFLSIPYIHTCLPLPPLMPKGGANKTATVYKCGQSNLFYEFQKAHI